MNGTPRERAHTLDMAALYGDLEANKHKQTGGPQADLTMVRPSEVILNGQKDDAPWNGLFCGHPDGDDEPEEASRIQVISQWTPEEVAVWLNCVNFGEYRQAFMAHDIGGLELLNLLSNKDYLAELK